MLTSRWQKPRPKRTPFLHPACVKDEKRTVKQIDEPCAVKARPLPPNVNTIAQNVAMKWIKFNVSSELGLSPCLTGVGIEERVIGGRLHAEILNTYVNT
jgi:hypothetical protein